VRSENSPTPSKLGRRRFRTLDEFCEHTYVLRASVVIATKDRKEELRVALRSAVVQTARPHILVIDDGSTDGTAEMVRAEFPAVVLRRFEESRGLIVRRNEGARIATGDVIFSIDDDAAFSTPQVVGQTLREFDDPRIGAVAIPYIEPRKGNRLIQKAPDADTVWITDRFIGTAHALRRDIFLKLGGYREHLVHQGEESDYCVRMLDAGYFVRLGNADPIHHFESPRRDFRRMDYYGARNAILFVWQNVPWPAFPLHLLATTFNVLCWTFRPGRFIRRLRAVLAGYGWCVANWSARRPVARSSYVRARALREAGSVRL
jgi:glycosyltransferase involved in cell wall biosynthesis